MTSSTTLLPSTYCNGLKVTNGATATLGQGIYIIDSAPLTVDGGATLTGSYVGIFLKGQQTTLKFDKDSTINLTAPKDGVMSGLLVFEDPTAPVLREHVITSNGARQLLGTIYLPRGRLKIDGDRPVGLHRDRGAAAEGGEVAEPLHERHVRGQRRTGAGRRRTDRRAPDDDAVTPARGRLHVALNNLPKRSADRSWAQSQSGATIA